MGLKKSSATVSTPCSRRARASSLQPRPQPLQPPRCNGKSRGVHSKMRSGVEQQCFANSVSPLGALPNSHRDVGGKTEYTQTAHTIQAWTPWDGSCPLTRTAVAPWSCYHTCVLRFICVRAQPQAACLHYVLRHCNALSLVPSAHSRLVLRCLHRRSSLFEGFTPFCAVASSNGALPTPSGLLQQYSVPLCDVGRKTKGIQTTRHNTSAVTPARITSCYADGGRATELHFFV